MCAKPLVVIGGGISGLSTAFYLKNAVSSAQRIVVLEKSHDVGGWIKSIRLEDGCVHDLGPRSMRLAGVQGLNSLSLAEDLGLSPSILGIPSYSPAAKKRLVYVENQLHQMPSRFRDIVFTKKPFSKPLLSYLVNDFKTPKLNLSEDDDISVYDFVNRRLGEELAKYVMDPVCRGITASDAKKLSMKALFPQIYRAAQEHGSIVKGMLKPRGENDQVMKLFMSSPLVKSARHRRWSMWSLKSGLQSMPEAIASHLLKQKEGNVDIHNDSEVSRISVLPDKTVQLTVRTTDEEVTLDAEHVFAAVPAHNLAETLDPSFTILRDALNSIKSVHVAVVALHYTGNDLLPPDKGFGFLTPSWEDHRILGVVFDSCAFPEHDAGLPIARLTCMMGGEWFEQLFGPVDNVNPEDLLNVAKECVRSYLGFQEEPNYHHVAVLKNCIPQYHLGHLKKVKVIEKEIRDKGLPVTLLGASYNGVSVNDCIFNSKKAVVHYCRLHGK